ncbi:ADP-ribosylation factor GTPase-activating protein [Tieghemiomyces parasiticus]|uniref:ADP-ribosylation factor GTPase-activating protein n=1 Tax=Tieghemiomyces parasiticus TaxID=78921 RepID=A0A9W8DVI8_9FUNG|nr:ADP-ribosylation factor GTPase-activating protein [Tieghemiomyces parasiticus]
MEVIGRLQALLREPSNSTCADCDESGPRWASVNLGIFICLRCSGIHRSLGTHLSQVRSVDLDRWEEVHVDTMQRVGNERARVYWSRTGRRLLAANPHDDR